MASLSKTSKRRVRLHRAEDVAAELGSLVRQEAEKKAEEIVEATLVEIRRLTGATQMDLAQKLRATQGQVSKTERKGDPRLSVLKRHIEALGGQLYVIAALGDRMVRLPV